jgi:monofunctional glycosyltransferase
MPAKNRRLARFRPILRKVLKVLAVLYVLHLVFVLSLRWIPVYFTPLIAVRGIEKLTDGKKIGYDKTWVNAKSISDHVKVAVICAEDQNFFKHNGFDLKAIGKALNFNEKNKKIKKIRGASTISQQTAKNVFLWPQRSWVRKGLEAYFTILIELFWGKKRILEVYLNVVELGDGIYGVEAASQKYWKTPASKLNIDKSSALAAVLPSPRRYSAAKPGPYIQGRKSWVQKQMRYNKPLYEAVN